MSATPMTDSHKLRQEENQGNLPGTVQRDRSAPRSGLNIRLGQKKPSAEEKSKPPEADKSSLGISLKVGKPPTAAPVAPKPIDPNLTTKPESARDTGVEKGPRAGISIGLASPRKKESAPPSPPTPPVVKNVPKGSLPKQDRTPLTIAQAPRTTATKKQPSEGGDSATAAAKPKSSGTVAISSSLKPKETLAPADKGATPQAPMAVSPVSKPQGGISVVPNPQESGSGVAKTPMPLQPKALETVAPSSKGSPAALSVQKPPFKGTPAPAVLPVEAPKVEKKEEKPDWLVHIQDEPASLQSLLEPEPEEVARLKQGYKQHRFMAQSVILEESGLSNQVRSAMLAVSLLIVAFFVWASLSSMDEIASTQGQVMPSSPAQLIQHLEGGIIREILVQEGQIIKKDALLVRLDSEGVFADLGQLKAKKASLRAQEIRLRAILSGKDADFNVIDQQYQSFIQGQHLLLLAQRSALASERGVLETRISRSQLRIENLLEQQQNIVKQRASLSQELGMKGQGYEQGVISRMAVLGSQRDFGRIEAEEVRSQGDLTTAKRELEEALGNLDELLKKAHETNLRELATVTTDLAQVEEQSRRLSDRAQRLEVRSPVWGVINNLQVNTVGGVITPGALIAEVIPMDSTRRVETRISTRDIGHVAVGQTVTVKVTTYDFARYGGINGILESISPTTFKQQDEKEPFYKGIIRLDKPYVGMNEKKNPVLPGMTVQADVDTGSKTLMEYMLKPIYASVNKAFRER